MKATFFYDIRFMKYNGKYYSHYGVNDSLMQRYIDIFGELTYFARNEIITNENKRYLTDENKITKFKVITFNENWYGLKTKIKEVLNNTEFAIIRLPSFAGCIAQKECEKMNIPYLVEVVGNSFEALWYHSLKTKLIAIPVHFIMKKTIKNSKFVSYITNDYLQKCYPTKNTTFNGISNVSLKLDNNIIDKRLEKINNTKLRYKKIINIGMIGALTVKYKGHVTAIKALKLVKEKYPNIKLKFLGQGRNKHLENICSKYGLKQNVEFCGSLPGGKPVMDWFDNIDIYIQPSITEGHGRSVVEAISRGCITFSSNAGGLVDSVNKKYLFKKRDYAKLADFILKAIEDEEFAEEVIKTEYNNIKKYDSKIIEKKRKESIQKVIEYYTNEENKSETKI